MSLILIAEDDEAMRSFISMALKKAGHQVIACEDGAVAYAELEADDDKKIELLLADIVMPGMDGIELAQKTSVLRPDIKIMFITGFAAVAMGKQNPNAEHARVLQKPFHLKDLVDQVHEMLAA